MAEVKVEAKGMTKDHLKEQAGKKIKRSKRLEVEIIKATKHYKLGQIIKPHKVIAEMLIKNKIAKEVK